MSDRIPSYRKKATKTRVYAVVTLPDAKGGRRDFVLGRYGTSDSRQEYTRRLAEWQAPGRTLPDASRRSEITIAELIAQYWDWVQTYYRRAQTRTNECHSGHIAHLNAAKCCSYNIWLTQFEAHWD
jgi:hypothetical protein